MHKHKHENLIITSDSKPFYRLQKIDKRVKKKKRKKEIGAGVDKPLQQKRYNHKIRIF